MKIALDKNSYLEKYNSHEFETLPQYKVFIMVYGCIEQKYQLHSKEFISIQHVVSKFRSQKVS